MKPRIHYIKLSITELEVRTQLKFNKKMNVDALCNKINRAIF
jgi:hypothetical protein